MTLREGLNVYYLFTGKRKNRDLCKSLGEQDQDESAMVTLKSRPWRSDFEESTREHSVP